MSYLEEVAQKRLDARQRAAVQAHNDSLAKSTDIDSLIAEMKQATVAQYLNGGKSTVVLTDQTDLGDKMGELGDRLDATIRELNNGDTNVKQLKSLESLKTAFDDFSSTVKGDSKANKQVTMQLLAAIRAIKAPVVHIPEANITVAAPDVDFSPLQETMKQYFSPPDVEKVDLDEYRAQDINNDDKNIQYIGFVNPSGAWYIIENDIKGNSLRYVFGSKGYKKAFEGAGQYKYLLLNEAINALSV